MFSKLSIDVDGHLTALRIFCGRLSSSSTATGTIDGAFRLQSGRLPKCMLSPRFPLKNLLHVGFGHWEEGEPLRAWCVVAGGDVDISVILKEIEQVLLGERVVGGIECGKERL